MVGMRIKALVAVVFVAMAVFTAAPAEGEYEPGKHLAVLRVEVILHPGFVAQLESQDSEFVSRWSEQLVAKTSAIALRDVISVIYRPRTIIVLENDAESWR